MTGTPTIHHMKASPSRLFVLSLLALLAGSTLAVAYIYWHIYGYDKLFGDFATFRTAALHARARELGDIYSIERVRGLFETHALKDFSFFLNPPTGLFIVYPLAFFDRLPGLVFWSLSQLLLLWAVLRSGYMRNLLRPSTQDAVSSSLMLAIVFLAFSLQNLLYGQLAALCSFLFLLVLLLRRTQPVWCGVALGIFSFKPQLGVLLPVLLLAEGNFRPLLWGVVTAFIMAGLSIICWGGGLWQDYVGMLALRGRFMAENPDLLFVLSTSIYAGVRNLGASSTEGLAIQGAVALAVVISLWPVLRKGRECDKILALALATYLVTPYSLIYDMPLLALPCVLLLRRAEADAASRSELIALLFLILMPVVTVLLQIGHIPYDVIAIGFGFIVARRRFSAEHAVNG